MRYFLELAYKGTRYHGWQVQPNAITVQSVLDEALEKMLGHPAPTLGSGRTDTGVHASRQYAHFDTDVPLDIHRKTAQLNAYLPNDIRVYDIWLVKPDAHARFDAVRRTYNYKVALLNNPFTPELAWHCKYRLDVPAMNRVAALLMNYEDFACFEKAGGYAEHSRCTMHEAVWQQEEDFLVFTISANRFLRGMVRAIVGTLAEVGRGKMSADEFETIIRSGNRKNAATAAPAHGLYLSRVQYPEGIRMDNNPDKNN